MDGVIFDMDGVLVDTEFFYFERRMAFCREQGIEPATDDIMDFVGETNQGIWKKLIPDNEELREQMKILYDDYRKKHPIDYRLFLNSDVKKVFETLKQAGKKIAIASSSPRTEIDSMVEVNQLGAYLDYIISGEELCESKPHPEIYLKAKKALGDGDYLAVEDSEIGIRSATSAGLYTIALKHPLATNQDLAKHSINYLKEVLDYL
ncbi:TPA: HAD family phosphatase [Streptococcus suis]|uniref:Phosphatase n=1 Tax=Streptococcus suis TaxID=1307 RepID=A0AB33UG14_STRSU|nr:HAD family phosphatase [Streptococcus suis]MDW8751764.1 HAD family phosphatase [Streptococcus suis]NQH64632.1 HAD family phosphatase [Streptococcus suis]NQS06117.1 HAD family phosphatase [Streptococcus suis]CYV03246.1 phosphatase [Streptococcus suis]CYX99213.1 phosphatase [Streptococcus suis]